MDIKRYSSKTARRGPILTRCRLAVDSVENEAGREAVSSVLIWIMAGKRWGSIERSDREFRIIVLVISIKAMR